MIADVIVLLENDVIHGVRRCNVVFTLERRYKYTCKRMRRGSKYWREFFSAEAEIWKKLETSNLFSSLIVQ